MRIKTRLRLATKRDINQYWTFQSTHYQEDKFYYPTFFVTNSKEFSKLEENKVYWCTIYVKQARNKEGKHITRSSTFLNFASKPVVNFKEASLGLFTMNCIVEEVNVLNDSIPVLRLRVLPEEETEAIYIWAFDDTLDIEEGKSYTLNCRLFNKTHYDDEGKPSSDPDELLENGNNKFYTEIRVDSVKK